MLEKILKQAIYNPSDEILTSIITTVGIIIIYVFFLRPKYTAQTGKMEAETAKIETETAHLETKHDITLGSEWKNMYHEMKEKYKRQQKRIQNLERENKELKNYIFKVEKNNSELTKRVDLLIDEVKIIKNKYMEGCYTATQSKKDKESSE